MPKKKDTKTAGEKLLGEGLAAKAAGKLRRRKTTMQDRLAEITGISQRKSKWGQK